MITTRANAAEEEYFRRQEAEHRRENDVDSLRQTARDERAEDDRLEAARLRRCPQCKTALQSRTLRGVKLDQCSSCHGIWLDAGQLEQLSKKRLGFVAKLLATWRGGVDK
jgi:uncharacterized protein